MAEDRDRRWAQVHRWLAAEEVAELLLVCGGCGDATPGAATRLPVVRADCCLADLPDHRVVELAAGGRAVAVLPDGCARAEEVRRRIAALDALIGGRVHLADALPPTRRRPWRRTSVVVDAAHPPVDRRRLVTTALRESLSGLPGAGPSPVTEHHRLVEALGALGTPGAPVRPAAAASATLAAPAAHVAPTTAGDPPPAEPPPTPGLRLVATDGCTACGVCVRVCPADALALDHDGATSTLLLSPGRCEGHGACIRSCPDEVLSGDGALTWSQTLGPAIPLATVATRVCARCRARFVPPETSPDVDRCRICRMRRDNPFSSFAPPGRSGQ